MKHFWIKENNVDWASLNVLAYSNRFGAFVSTTEIPSNRRLKVVLKKSFNTDNGEQTTEFASDVIDSLKIVQRASKRSFILFKDSIPVGWATFHRKHDEVKEEPKAEENPTE